MAGREVGPVVMPTPPPRATGSTAPLPPSPQARDASLDQLCINTVRTLAMDAVQQADSGHPGTAMALAPLAYVLWQRQLRYNPANPDWFGRDRFVLSAGHACMLLYAGLYLTGYDLPRSEEHTSELQSQSKIVCRPLLEKKKTVI